MAKNSSNDNRKKKIRRYGTARILALALSLATVLGSFGFVFAGEAGSDAIGSGSSATGDSGGDGSGSGGDGGDGSDAIGSGSSAIGDGSETISDSGDGGSSVATQTPEKRDNGSSGGDGVLLPQGDSGGDIETLGVDERASWDLSNFTEGIDILDPGNLDADGKPTAVLPTDDDPPVYYLEDQKQYILSLTFEEIFDGLGFAYNADPNDTVTDGWLRYTLPAGISIDEEALGDEQWVDSTNPLKPLGKFVIRKDAETDAYVIEVQFGNVDEDGETVEENFIYGNRNAGFDIEMDATFDSTSGGSDFSFGHDKTINVKPSDEKPTLEMKKTASNFIPSSETIEYKIEITAKGGPVHDITLWDYAKHLTKTSWGTTTLNYIFREDGQTRGTREDDGINIFPYGPDLDDEGKRWGPDNDGGHITVTFPDDKTVDFDQLLDALEKGVPWRPTPVTAVEVPGLPNLTQNPTADKGVGLSFDMDELYYYGEDTEGSFTLPEGETITIKYTMELSEWVKRCQKGKDEEAMRVYDLGYIDNIATANGKDAEEKELGPIIDETRTLFWKQEEIQKSGTGKSTTLTVYDDKGKAVRDTVYQLDWLINAGSGGDAINGHVITDTIEDDQIFKPNVPGASATNAGLTVVLRDIKGVPINWGFNDPDSGWEKIADSNPERWYKKAVDGTPPHHSVQYIPSTGTFWFGYEHWNARENATNGHLLSMGYEYIEDDLFGRIEVTKDGFSYTLPAYEEVDGVPKDGIPEIYFADIKFSTVDPDPSSRPKDYAYQNTVKKNEASDTATVTQGAVGVTVSKSNKIVHTAIPGEIYNPAYTEDDKNYIEYTVDMTVPAGNLHENLYFIDRADFSTTETLRPNTIPDIRDKQVRIYLKSGEGAFVLQNPETSALEYQIHPEFSTAATKNPNAWAMTFGDDRTGETSPTDKTNIALTDACLGNGDSWPFDTAVTVRIVYEVPLSTKVYSPGASGSVVQANGQDMTVGSKLNNGVVEATYGYPNATLTNNADVYQLRSTTALPTSYIARGTDNLRWPIVKSAAPSAVAKEDGAEGGAYYKAGDVKIPYMVKLNQRRSTERPMFVEGHDEIIFTDRFDEILAFDPYSFRITVGASVVNGKLTGGDTHALTDLVSSELGGNIEDYFDSSDAKDGKKTVTINLYDFVRANLDGMEKLYKKDTTANPKPYNIVLTYDLILDAEEAAKVGDPEDNGLLYYDNEATIHTTDGSVWDGSFSSAETASYGAGAVTKAMAQDGTGNSVATTTIVINADGKDLVDDADFLTVNDVMSDTLLLYSDTVKVWTDGDWKYGDTPSYDTPKIDDGNRDERERDELATSPVEGDAWTWAWDETEEGTTIGFVIPDETPVKITYQILIQGAVGKPVKVENTVTVAGKFSKSVLEDFTVSASKGSGRGGFDTLTLMKEDADSGSGAGLAGAQFALYMGLKKGGSAEGFNYGENLGVGIPDDYVVPPASGLRQKFDIEDSGMTFFYLQLGTTDDNGEITFEEPYLVAEAQDKIGAVYALVETAAPDGYAPVTPLPLDGEVSQNGLDSVRLFRFGIEDGQLPGDEKKQIEAIANHITIENTAMYISVEVDKDTIKRTSAAFDGTDAAVTVDGGADSAIINNVGKPAEHYRYDIDFRSTSSVDVDEFVVDDPLESVAKQDFVRLEGLWTPSVWGDMDGLMNVWYQTANGSGVDMANVNPLPATVTKVVNPVYPTEPYDFDGRGGGWKLWRQVDQRGDDHSFAADGVIMRERLELPDGIAESDYVTAIRFEYGAVKVGFTSRNTAKTDELQMNDSSAENEATEIRNTNGSLAYYNAENGAEPMIAALGTPAVIENTLPTTAEPAEENGVPDKGETADWTTPAENAEDYPSYYPSEADDLKQLSGATLKPATYLVSATRPLADDDEGDDETVDIVSSAAAKIAKYVPATETPLARGGMFALAATENSYLYDQDQDAVLTHVIMPSVAEPDDGTGRIEQDGDPSFVTEFEGDVLEGQWYTGTARRVVTVARTEDAFALGLWLVVALCALICVLLLIRTLPAFRKKERSPDGVSEIMKGGESK